MILQRIHWEHLHWKAFRKLHRYDLTGDQKRVYLDWFLPEDTPQLGCVSAYPFDPAHVFP
jgi:hypothetical protein